MFALCGEEIGPGHYFGMLLEQCATLAFGHPTPHPELDAIVEGIGAAFQDHRAMPADHGGFALGRATYEQFVGVSLAASSLGNPRDPVLGLHALDQTAGKRGGDSCPARNGPCCRHQRFPLSPAAVT